MNIWWVYVDTTQRCALLVMDKPQIIGHIQRSVDFTLFDCAWIPVSTKFVVVGSKPRGTGTIQVYDVTAKEVKLQCEVSEYIPVTESFQKS